MTDVVEPDWSRIGEVPALVAALYKVVDELETIFPGRHFTPYGHLVGSLGESLAAYAFNVDSRRGFLLPGTPTRTSGRPRTLHP